MPLGGARTPAAVPLPLGHGGFVPSSGSGRRSAALRGGRGHEIWRKFCRGDGSFGASAGLIEAGGEGPTQRCSFSYDSCARPKSTPSEHRQPESHQPTRPQHPTIHHFGGTR